MGPLGQPSLGSDRPGLQPKGDAQRLAPLALAVYANLPKTIKKEPPMNLFWWQEPCQALDHVALQKATRRQQRALKPSGGLGQLEPVLIRLAGMQGREKPRLDQICMSVFIADHGVAEAGISAAPQSLTGVLLRSTVEGGALSVLARQLNASLEVIGLGTARPVWPNEGRRPF